MRAPKNWKMSPCVIVHKYFGYVVAEEQGEAVLQFAPTTPALTQDDVGDIHLKWTWHLPPKRQVSPTFLRP